MKKFLTVLAVLLVASAFASAESINLGQFPKGQWLDANWNAVWEFGADDIRLLDVNGNVLFDFKDKITDLEVDIGVSEANISFACKETERKYVFTKGVTNLDLVMSIDPDWTTTDYKVTMKMQK